MMTMCDVQRYKKMIKVKPKFAHIMKNNEFCQLKTQMTQHFMIKKLTILSLLIAIIACPDVAMARKKKDKDKNKNQNTQVIFEPVVEEVDYPISNPKAQINGEWNVVEINGDEVNLPRGSRAYLYFDVDAGQLYGNTGCNSLSAKYSLDGNKFHVDALERSDRDGGYYAHVERKMMDCLDDATSLALSQKGEVEYMEMKKGRNVIMKLRRQNLDFMNGQWLVRRINGIPVKSECQINLVNDIDTKTVNIVSGSNIINGAIYIDPMVEFGIEYEDLKSTHNQWPHIDTETRLLISLEEAQYCRRLNDNEVELYTKELDQRGKQVDKTLVVLEKISL